MKNTILLIFTLIIVSCTTPPQRIDGEPGYSEISKSTIKLENISYPENLRQEGLNIFVNLRNGLLSGWPDMELLDAVNEKMPNYYLSLNILGYEAKYNASKRQEKIDKKKTNYKVYRTLTYLNFSYTLKDKASDKIVWSKTINSKDISTNEEIDNCSSSSLFDELLCEVIVEPIIDGIVDLVLSPLGQGDVPDKKYNSPTSFEEMFYLVGRDIGKSLPEPYCSTDGFIACTSYFFRNELQR